MPPFLRGTHLDFLLMITKIQKCTGFVLALKCFYFICSGWFRIPTRRISFEKVFTGRLVFDVANEGCELAGFLKAKIVPHSAFRFSLFEKFYNHPILVFWNEFEKNIIFHPRITFLSFVWQTTVGFWDLYWNWETLRRTTLNNCHGKRFGDVEMMMKTYATMADYCYYY